MSCSSANMTRDPEAFAIPAIPLDRTCACCDEHLPESEFSGPKATVCNQCKNRSGYARKVIKLESVLTRVAGGMLAAKARGDCIQAPRVSQVATKMFELLGGVDGFCQKYKAQLDKAIEKNPGSAVVLRQFTEMVKMTKMSSDSMDSTAATAELSDGDLQKEIDGIVAKMLNEQMVDVDPAMLEGSVAEADHGIDN